MSTPQTTCTTHLTNTSKARRRHLLLAAAVAISAGVSMTACERDTDSSHPARDDVDAGWTCSVDSDVVRASGTITNHSTKTSFYIVETEFRLDGHVVDHRSTSVDDVGPGETVRVETASDDVVDDDVTCSVISVDRFKA